MVDNNNVLRFYMKKGVFRKNRFALMVTENSLRMTDYAGATTVVDIPFDSIEYILVSRKKDEMQIHGTCNIISGMKPDRSEVGSFIKELSQAPVDIYH